MEKVYIANDPHEKAMQRALIQYKDPKNYELVHEALIKAHRTDLIGFDKKCLIKPRNTKDVNSRKKSAKPLTEEEKKYGISFEKYDMIQNANKNSKPKNKKRR